MASLIRSLAALLINWGPPGACSASRIAPEGPALLALLLLYGLFLTDDRRAHWVVDDLGLFLDLRAPVGTDVDVRRLLFRLALLTRDLGALLDDLAFFHVYLHCVC